MNFKMRVFINALRLNIKILSFFSDEYAARYAFRLFSTPHRKSKKTEPEIFRKSEKISIAVDGETIYGYRWNSSSPKRALIVHGFESRAFNFESYIEPLIKHGYAVYAMDAKAHGNSTGKTIIVTEYISMLDTLEKHYGVFDALIGHSFGGLAISLFIEKFPRNDSRLVLIAPATETSTALKLFCTFFKINKTVQKQIYNFIFKGSGQPVEYFSIKRAVQNIPNQILWIHDNDDEITPISDVDPIILNHKENLHFIITDELGHRKIYRDSSVMQRIFAFLQK